MRISRQLLVVCGGLLSKGALGFAPSVGKSPFAASSRTRLRLSDVVSTTTDSVLLKNPENNPSDQWELDCYSRPVMVDGKKLWEVLITDSSNSFRYLKTLPSNQVNSRVLRGVVEDFIDDSEVKPATIRFFRKSMFNMINIALAELDVIGSASRCTFSLASWLEERHKDVYPQMPGYRESMVSMADNPSFFFDKTPVKMPDALRGEKYAFVGLPLAEFMPGGGVTDENIGSGRLCTIPEGLPADAFVQGLVILTSRAKALATWLAGTELAGMSADLRKRTLVMEVGLDKQYLMAKLNDVQRQEAAAFEEGKEALGGLHFISVQKDEDDDPAGFWLLRDLPSGI